MDLDKEDIDNLNQTLNSSNIPQFKAATIP